MLPMVELAIFALGILLIDLMIPRGWKWINAVGAFAGVLFAAVCVWQIQSTLPRGAVGFYNSLLVDRFAIYFWYLFLAGAAIAILMSVHYLDVEDEHHGEYYSLLLLSVVGMMCLAAGIDIVLLFIGHLCLWPLALLRNFRQHQSEGYCARRLGAESAQSGDGDRAADNHDRIAVQDRRRPVSPVGAGRLRRRTHQHYWLHVGRSEGGGMGAAASHTSVWVVAAALRLHSRHGGCRHRHHDRRQLRGTHSDEHETAAGLLFDCPRRLHAAGLCSHGNVADRQPGLSRRLQGNPDLLARLYVHEPGSLRGD